MKPFDDLVPLLIDAIPAAIAAVKPTEPICAVRIYYFDTHAPLAYLTLRLVSEEDRARVVADKGPEAPFYLWGSGEECGQSTVDLPHDPPESAADQRIATLFESVYALLCESEEANMPDYRAMLQKVAWKLNERDWKSICSVTDDFVVAPADGSMFFGGDDLTDLIKSIPLDRLDVLRERGFLGVGDDWLM